MKLRPVQRHDVNHPDRLFDYMRELEQTVRDLHATTIKQQAHIIGLGRQVMAIEPPPKSLDAIPGIAMNPQNPQIPRLSALPDPHNTQYTQVVVTGTPDKIYWLDVSTLPKKWRKIADLP